MVTFLLAAGLTLYNNVANLVPAFNGALFVPLNCIVAGLVLAVGLGPLSLSGQQMGVAGNDARDLLVGLTLGLALTLPLYAALLSRRTAALIADRRVAGLGGAGLAYQTLVRIPLGTALLEEVAFRGVLFASWRQDGDVEAAVLSSLAFGLWHISPTLNLLRANRPHAAPGIRVSVVVGAVCLTSVAGAGLVWLRVESAGLLAPWALHAALNSGATMAAALAHRRT